MSGLNDLLQAIDTGAQAGEETILATVVKVEGSAYRRPGARMLIPCTAAPSAPSAAVAWSRTWRKSLVADRLRRTRGAPLQHRRHRG